MKRHVQFDVVLAHLHEWQSAMVAELKATGGNEVALETKRQIDRAIGCLTLCEGFQIHPDSVVTVVPWARDQFGSFILVDAGDGDGKETWQPVSVGGQFITLSPGDLAVATGHCLSIPEPDP